jgi:hypothetical protein
MCACTTSKSGKMEDLSAGGLGWQVPKVSGMQAEGGSYPFKSAQKCLKTF